MCCGLLEVLEILLLELALLEIELLETALHEIAGSPSLGPGFQFRVTPQYLKVHS
jgi:hypothetical protein